jgi:outer membrane protein TolC
MTSRGLHNGNRLPAVTRLLQLALVALLPVASTAPAQGTVSLEQAIARAQRNDPWLAGSEFRQRALEAQSTAAGTLPDPVVNLALANLPTDTFEFNQEPMTQFVVGLSQMLPRGESLTLNSKRLALLGSQEPHQREERRAMVSVTVAQLWLEAFRAQESIRLIEGDRALFEHLVDVAESSYAAALGRTRQQDLVRAQLELTRLEDRLTMLHEKLDMSRSRLAEWLQPAGAAGAAPGMTAGPGWLALPAALPEITLQQPGLYRASRQPTHQEIAEHLRDHPAIQSLEARIAASDTGVALAEQKYRPEWKINASYGYRDDDPSGNDRADFFSVGIAFDLPLFTGNRQDQEVQSAAASAEAVRTERALALRSMVSAFETQRARLLRLEQRRALYGSRLLEEMREQAEASLTAYTNDDGDFAEVVRARIAELNARVDALDIEIDRLKTISQLNYFFAKSDD